jgi:hypothetical protein
LGGKVAPFGPQAAVFFGQILQAQGLATGKVVQEGFWRELTDSQQVGNTERAKRFAMFRPVVLA